MTISYQAKKISLLIMTSCPIKLAMFGHNIANYDTCTVLTNLTIVREREVK